jgi:hypothetical protein
MHGCADIYNLPACKNSLELTANNPVTAFQMIYPKILTPIFICLCLAACDTQQQTAPAEKTSPINEVTEKARPPLDLSLEHLPAKVQQNSGELFFNQNETTEENSDLFNLLNRDKTEPKIKLSGKVFADEVKLVTRDYFGAIKGVQINIEGNFK